MSNIYNQAIRQVMKGSRFNVDFRNRSLAVNGKYLIRDASFHGSLGVEFTVSPLAEIERLYDMYRHSIPSERSESKRFTYFKALREEQLSDEDMLYGEQRDIAQLKLEMYVLMCILNGSLIWSNFAEGKWFWQSEQHPTLVILKSWIE